MRKRKILRFFGIALCVILGVLVFLAITGTVAHAAGLADNTVSDINAYSQYPLENYQLDFYVDSSWDWLPWNWLDGIGKSIQYGLYAITNFVWTVSLYISNATGYVVQEAYKLDFISDTASSIGKNIQTLAGVTSGGFSSEGFYVGFLLILILVMGIYVAYTGLIKRETTKAVHAVVNFLVVFILSASFIAYAPNYISKINDFSADISSSALSLGTKIVLPDSNSKGKDSVDLIRDSLFSIQVKQPWLLLQYGESDVETLGADRVESLLSASPDTDDREDVVIDEIEDRDNANLSVTKTMSRLGTVVFLFIFNIGISIFVFLLTGMMIFSQVLFIIYAMFLPVSFLLSMIPTYENMAKQAVVRVFNAIMTRAGITLIVTVAFSISSMFYNISTDYPFFMVAFLQIICFAGIYMKLGELMSMFSLNANDSQQIGRRIFRRPMVFMRHRARRMERRLARAVGTGSMVGAGAGAVAGSAYNHSRSTHKNTPARPQRNNEVSIGSRVGFAVGAVMDTKNKVRDSASSLKENVKDLPTQAGYAVHSAKQKAKDNVSDFKRGVVEERENRQEQRTQKRNLHRENISQKKQELQKAQEARQTVHANGSATAGATRSHERPVATPVPKTAQTDTVIKPDMKRPATSPVIKNAEVKAGKETVRPNIRQEQQVKSVARKNQTNVAESISNHKKSTVQKTQVNGKSARKTVTKQSEKGRKK